MERGLPGKDSCNTYGNPRHPVMRQAISKAISKFARMMNMSFREVPYAEEAGRQRSKAFLRHHSPVDGIRYEMESTDGNSLIVIISGDSGEFGIQDRLRFLIHAAGESLPIAKSNLCRPKRQMRCLPQISTSARELFTFTRSLLLDIIKMLESGKANEAMPSSEGMGTGMFPMSAVSELYSFQGEVPDDMFTRLYLIYQCSNMAFHHANRHEFPSYALSSPIEAIDRISLGTCESLEWVRAYERAEEADETLSGRPIVSIAIGNDAETLLGMLGALAYEYDAWRMEDNMEQEEIVALRDVYRDREKFKAMVRESEIYDAFCLMREGVPVEDVLA